MQFCQRHWQMLRAEVAAQGMESLVAKGGEQAAAQLVSSIRDGSSKSNFDPLMAAHNAIVGNVLDAVGLAVMTPNEDGTDKCPLCFITAAHAATCKKPDCKVTNWDDWIGLAVRDAKAEAVRLGLVGNG